MSLTNYRLYAIDGANALAPEPFAAPSLVLIEGGKNQKRRSPRASQHVATSALRSVTGLQVLFVALVSVVIAGCLFMPDALAAMNAEGILSNVNSVSVSVQKGDSLWSIASQHGVDGCSTGQVVEWIKGQNHLSTSNIIAGQQLIVPSTSQL